MQTIRTPLTPASPPATVAGRELLQGHIARVGITQAAFAERVHVSKGYITELLNGSKRPSLGLAVRIEAETDGYVRVSSWVEAEVEPVTAGSSK